MSHGCLFVSSQDPVKLAPPESLELQARAEPQAQLAEAEDLAAQPVLRVRLVRAVPRELLALLALPVTQVLTAHRVHPE